MTDVRLTATNPEDSSVVPVACNEKGELILEEPGEGPPGPKGDPGDPFMGNFEGDVTFTGGDATFAGNVGIGTTEPDAKLIVADANVAAIGINNNTGGQLALVAANDNNGHMIRFGGTTGPGEDGTVTPTILRFVTVGNNERMRIDSVGNVGIGATLPEGKLDIQTANGERVTFTSGGSNQHPQINLLRDSGTDYTIDNQAGIFRLVKNSDPAYQLNADHHRWYTPGVAAMRMVVAADGNVGIGPNWPTTPLDVGGKCGFLADGGIWMTDQRGNTYRSDFVSNGMLTWTEYTPPSRRDQLEALKDRIEEQGQSTQDGTTTDIDDPRLK